MEKGLVCSQPTLFRFCCPTCPGTSLWSSPGAAQVLHSHRATLAIRDGSLHLTFLPETKEAPIPIFQSQLLVPSPGWSCCLSQPPPVPLQGDGAKSQSKGKQQAWSRGESSSCSSELRTNCPSLRHWGDPAKELAQLCDRRWCWGQHSDQFCHPHLPKSWSSPEQLLSYQNLLPDTPGDVSDSRLQVQPSLQPTKRCV